MTANELLVRNWLRDVCPSFLDVLTSNGASKPAFIVHRVEGTDIPTTRLFFRSPISNSWDSLPYFSQILAGCTEKGRAAFQRAVSGRTENIIGDGNTYVTGPSSILPALRYNNAIQGGTMKERVKAIAGKSVVGVPVAGGLNGTAFDVSFRQALGEEGFTGMSEWVSTQAGETFNETGRSAVISRLGVGKVVFVVENTFVNGSATAGHLMTVDAFDDSFQLWRSTSSGTLVSYLETDSYYTKVGTYLIGVDSVSQLPEQTQRLVAFRSALNPSLPAIAVKPGFGLTNFATLVGSLPLDSTWLPMHTVPRSQDYFVRAGYEHTSVATETLSDMDIVVITMTAVDVLGGVPVQWYLDYAAEKIASGAANTAELKKSSADMAEYSAKTITYCEMSTAVMLPSNLVELTAIYNDYAKAKEKACEDNDFMSREFAPGVTYNTVNTTINGSRNTRIFYGYRDSEAMPSLSPEVAGVYAYIGWTVTLGGDTVAVRRSDGTFAPSLPNSVESVGELLQFAEGGATIVGGTVESQLAIWGISVSDVAAAREGLGAAMAKVHASSKTGTASALYDFRWASLGVSGYPDYPSVEVEEQYRIAMVSKALLGAIGKKLRQLQLEEVQSSYVNTLFK